MDTRNDSIGVLLGDSSAPCATSFFCVGHTDPATNGVHSSAWDRYGRHGVAVTQNDGHDPLVSLVDLDHPQADFTAEEAIELIYGLAQATADVWRARTPTPMDGLLRDLGATLNALGLLDAD